MLPWRKLQNQYVKSGKRIWNFLFSIIDYNITKIEWNLFPIIFPFDKIASKISNKYKN